MRLQAHFATETKFPKAQLGQHFSGNSPGLVDCCLQEVALQHKTEGEGKHFMNPSFNQSQRRLHLNISVSFQSRFLLGIHC